MIQFFYKILELTLNTVLSWFMKCILLACLIYLSITGDYILGMGALLALLLSLMPQILHRNYKITFPWEIDLLIAFSLVLHIFFGEFLDFYGTVPYYDKFLHFFGTATISILGFMAVYAIHYLTPIELTLKSMGFFTVIFAMAVGSFWEIAEFMVDKMWGLKTQMGLDDTMWDLIWDFWGGLVVALLGMYYVKYLEKKSRKKFHRSVREAFHIKDKPYNS